MNNHKNNTNRTHSGAAATGIRHMRAMFNVKTSHSLPIKTRGAAFASLLATLLLPLSVAAQTAGTASDPLGMGAMGGMAGSAGVAGASSPASAPPVPGVSISNIPILPASGQPGAAQPNAQTDPFNAAQNQRQMRQPAPPSAFEKFVLTNTGRVVRPFGANLFVARAFGPQANAAVPGDYVLAPGDEVLIYAWGGISINYRTTVDRAGQINIPRVGAFTVAGVRAADLENNLRGHIGRYFTNFQLSASVSQVRGLQVYVVGQAAAPGMYTLPGTSTLVSAVFDAAEPGPNGSYRRVQLKRGNRIVTELDLYEFIARGESGGDVRLVSGDVIVIPPVGPRVAVLGAVDNSAIFELKSAGESLDEVLKLAGTGRALADTSRVQLERVNPADANAPRSVMDVPLSTMGKTTLLADGDMVTVLEGRPAFANAVTLRGNVAYPLRHAFKPGMKVRDLIPGKEALITSDYYRRANSLVQRLDDDARLRERFVEGFIQDERRAGFRLGEGVEPRGDYVVNPYTGAVVPGVTTQTAAQRAYNQQLLSPGAVAGNSQGPQQGGLNAGATAQLNAASGAFGQLGVFGNNNAQQDTKRPVTEVKNLLDEINWDYAVVERLDRDALKPTLLPFNLGKALADANSSDNLSLKPGDVVTVFSVKDFPVPKAKRSAFVRVAGEVKAPGVYAVEPGDTLRDVVRRAGGFTSDAFVYGSELRRESTRTEQEKRYTEALNQIEKDISRAASVTAAGALSAEDAAGKQAQIESQRRLLERLRAIKPSGRVVLALNEEAKSLTDLPNLSLEDGDVLEVPARPATVNVFGSVFGEGAYLHRGGDTIGDMISQAGGSVRTADVNSTFVIRPNGTVISARQSSWNWLTGLNGRRAQPGDTIVVPEDYERVPNLRFFKDVATIFGQFGLGIAAVRVINR